LHEKSSFGNENAIFIPVRMERVEKLLLLDELDLEEDIPFMPSASLRHARHKSPSCPAQVSVMPGLTGHLQTTTFGRISILAPSFSLP
jgi:hypothetical protein